jgi:hypothetical protein
MRRRDDYPPGISSVPEPVERGSAFLRRRCGERADNHVSAPQGTQAIDLDNDNYIQFVEYAPE